MSNDVGRLSYSSASKLLKCQKQYLFDKILRLPPDPDIVEDTTSLKFGSCYHKTLELTRHKRSNFQVEMLEKVMTDEGLDPWNATLKYSVYACMDRYWTLREKTRLEIAGIETEIGDDTLVGYVDCTLVDSSGNWWGCDLKTSSWANAGMYARLCRDLQLNLYAAHSNQLAEKLGLDPNKFAGMLYNVVSKPKAVPKTSETMQAFAARISCDCTEISLPKELLDPAGAMREIKQIREIAENLTSDNAICNHGACFDYFRPCPHHSKCHGVSYTELSESLNKYTQASAIDMTLPGMEIVSEI